LANKNQIQDKDTPRDTSLARTALSILNGRIFTSSKVVKLLPFIFYLVFIIMLYVANSYYSEKTKIELDHLKKEMKSLRDEYISTKSNLMFISKQSEVAKRLEQTGIKESTVPPVKLKTEE